MGAEQMISASAFTHRGEEFASNTGNFLLDGRQPFDFELDSSHVSIIDHDRNFFFAVCDTKLTDDLNASVSGIKELKKLHAQIKTGARDIKSNTEILGECFVGTEDLLYDTAGYADRDAARPSSGSDLSSLDKRLVTYAGKEMEDEDDIAGDAGDSDVDEYSGRVASGSAAGDEDDDFIDADDRDYEEDDEYDDIEPPPDLTDLEPGKKGFSSVGFILSERKGSILAQGDCEAFMFRGGSLRVLSGGSKKVSVTLNRSPESAGPSQQNRNKPPQAKPYGGRSSEIFEPREGDVYLLCTTSVVAAIGEENIDGYLSMNEELAAINGSIMYDAVKSDPSSNMTCMLVRVDEIRDDEASAAAGSVRRGADYGRQDAYGYNGGMQGAGAGGAAAGAGGIPAPAAPVSGARPGQGSPPYMEQDTRISQIPYQNRDAFSKRATSRFDAPPRKIPLASNRSLITSIITTVVLFAILIVSYFIYFNNREGGNGAAGNNGTTTGNFANASTTTAAGAGNGDMETNGNDNPSVATESRTTTTTSTTTTTTTEPPEQEYTVKSGDTLMRIAQRFYGNSNATLYTLIKERNSLPNDKITIGQVLIIPPKPESSSEAGAQDGDAATEEQGEGTTAGRQSATTTVR